MASLTTKLEAKMEAKMKHCDWKVLLVQSPHNPCFDLLEATKVRDIATMDAFFTKSQICVKTSDSFKTVVKTLMAHNIHSVPVVQEVEHLDGGTVAGFIDMLDICTFLTHAFPAIEQQEEQKMAECAVLDHPAWMIINSSNKDTMFAIHQDHPVSEALDLMRKGVHHMTVFDDRKHLTGILSHIDMVRLLADRFDKATYLSGTSAWKPTGHLSKFGKRSLESLGYGQSRMLGASLPPTVISILPSVTVSQAVAKLASVGIQALAIVAPDTGHLIGNFSAGDVVNAVVGGKTTETILSLMNLSVASFLERFSPASLEPEVMLASSSLESVCKLMARKRIHQVWVIQDVEPTEARIPIGLINMTDISRIVAGNWSEQTPVHF